MRIFVIILLFMANSNSFAGNVIDDFTIVIKPANKLCLTGKSLKLAASSVIEMSNVEIALSAVDCFPENSSQKNAYSTLINLIHPQSYGEVVSSLRGKNAGLIAYFDRRVKNDDLFFTQAKAFYGELDEISEKFYGLNPDRFHYQNLINFTLDEAAGKGIFSGIKPGWLWKLAVKHAKNDRKRAIEIIGLCGHDDAHFDQIRGYDGKREFDCPNMYNSLFYLPKSLGDEVDLSENFKLKIAQVQAPNMGMQALPSKVYHYYGGALFACLMKDQGLSNSEIEASSSLIAKLYRILDLRNRILMYVDYSKENQIKLKERINQDCKFGNELGLAFNCSGFEEADFERKDRWVNGKLTEYDSYFLIDRWKMIKKIPILNLPVNFDLTITDEMLEDQPDGWSKERFNKAVMRIRTYAIDAEWTASQHKIGARFAEANCSR